MASDTDTTCWPAPDERARRPAGGCRRGPASTTTSASTGRARPRRSIDAFGPSDSPPSRPVAPLVAQHDVVDALGRHQLAGHPGADRAHADDRAAVRSAGHQRSSGPLELAPAASCGGTPPSPAPAARRRRARRAQGHQGPTQHLHRTTCRALSMAVAGSTGRTSPNTSERCHRPRSTRIASERSARRDSPRDRRGDADGPTWHSDPAATAGSPSDRTSLSEAERLDGSGDPDARPAASQASRTGSPTACVARTSRAERRITARTCGPSRHASAGVAELGLAGIEPTTSPLSGVRSNRLSYSPVRAAA